MNSPVPGGTPGGGFPGGGPPLDPCNSAECTGAKSEFSAAKTAFTKDCNGLRYIKNWLDVLKPIVNVSIWWIILFLILAVIFGLLTLWFLAIIFWVLILIYVVAWILYLVLGRTAASLAQSLVTDAQAIQDAIAKIV